MNNITVNFLFTVGKKMCDIAFHFVVFLYQTQSSSSAVIANSIVSLGGMIPVHGSTLNTPLSLVYWQQNMP